MKDDFREIRSKCTPWVAVVTPDYREAIRTLSKVRTSKEEEAGIIPPIVIWDCASGHSGNDEASDALSQLGAPDETKQSPRLVVERALGFPDEVILFMVFPDSKELMEDPILAQGIANLRTPWKGKRCTLVLVGPEIRLPPLLKADVPVLYDPLPDSAELKDIAKKVYETAGVKYKDADLARCADALAGLTHFAAEEGCSRKIRKKGMDFEGLNALQRSVIEETTGRALLFEREKWTFEQMGGLDGLKSLMADLFAGEESPVLVVRIDEIEKSITAAAQGSVADNTGISQDILGQVLKNMEDNGWMGLMAVGGPGTGKTLASICTGNTFGVRTLVLDLNATKASLAGESERRIRQVMEVIKTIGGRRVLMMATANRLDTLPPELQARFWLGTWFWDTPSKDEKANIWKIQRSAYGIKDEYKTPDDADWVGRDIRNCCKMAWKTGTDLVKASKRLTIAGRSSKPMIERLRDLAETSGFISANTGEPYKKPKAVTSGTRKLDLN